MFYHAENSQNYPTIAQEFQWGALRASIAAAGVAARRRLWIVAAARGVEMASPVFSPLKRSLGSSSVILSAPLHRLTTHSPSAGGGLNSVGGLPLQLQLQQQRRNFAGRTLRRGNSRREDDEVCEQKQEDPRKQSSSDRQGGDDTCQDEPSVVQRVLEAAQRHQTCGSSFWASQREEVMSNLKEGKLSLSTAALVVVAFSRAGELTGPLAAAVARRLSTAFRAAARRGASPLLMGEGGPSLERALTTETGEVDFRVHFGDGATVLLAMKEAGLFEDTCAGAAARELQEALLQCVEPQWNSLTFAQLRRLFLLLGATAEPLGIDMATVRELLTATKRYLRKMQKTSRRVFEEGDASEIVALAWPLACVSAAVKIPAPQISEDNGGRGSLDCFTSKYDDMKMLHRDRDVVLRLAKAQIHRAVCSRLPCTPFDLALGFAGLERLGQKSCAEYVLTAFSTTAAGASCEELCRLGRDIMLAGIRQKALWEAFADAVQTAAEQRRQTPPSQEHNSNSQRIEAELAQWLRFCGRIV